MSSRSAPPGPNARRCARWQPDGLDNNGRRVFRRHAPFSFPHIHSKETNTMSTITMLEAEKMIIAAYKADEPLFLLGKPGMGKSALFRSCAKQLDIGHLDFRFTQRDPVDIGGMRIPDQKT